MKRVTRYYRYSYSSISYWVNKVYILGANCEQESSISRYFGMTMTNIFSRKCTKNVASVEFGIMQDIFCLVTYSNPLNLRLLWKPCINTFRFIKGIRKLILISLHEWAQCSLIIGTGCQLKFLARSSIIQSIYQRVFSLLAIWCQRIWFQILHSAEGETYLLSISISLACARAPKLTTIMWIVRTRC